MKEFDILVVGELNPDLIVSKPDLQPRFDQTEIIVDSAVLRIGSSSAIFACGAARLGLKVAFVSVVGDDLFGKFVFNSLKGHGVDVSAVKVDSDLETGLSVILSRGEDRAILTHLGSINAVKASQVTDDLLMRSRHLHLASYFLQTDLQPDVPGIFQKARSHGLTISLDTNWDPDLRWNQVRDILPLVDVFLPNRNEALAITGRSSLDSAMAALAENVSVVAVKLGREGAIAREGTEVVSAGVPQVNVVDTIGAGDSFDAGFVYGYLHQWDLKKALQMAVVCGSLSTRAAGGTNGQPTLEEAMAYLNAGKADRN